MTTKTNNILTFKLIEWTERKSNHDGLKDFLSSHDLLDVRFVYRGFNANRIPLVEQTGTDRDESSKGYIDYLSPKQYLRATPPNDPNLATYNPNEERINLDWAANQAFFEGKNAIAIYDESKLQRTGPSHLVYTSNNFLDALVKIVIVN
jgi:hypothetical protein